MGMRTAFGRGLAKVAKNIGKGALAVSQDPQTVAEIATLVGHPEVVPVIAVTTPVVRAVVRAVQNGHPGAVAVVQEATRAEDAAAQHAAQQAAQHAVDEGDDTLRVMNDAGH